MTGKVLLEVNRISKSFGNTHALREVSVAIKAGEIHGLIGENGSGKSTLASIIAGGLQMDAGELIFNGKPYVPKDLTSSMYKGICMVMQEMGTISSISVMANIFLGIESRFSKSGVVDIAAMRTAAGEMLQKVQLDHLEPDALTSTLSFEEKKVVEIARALYLAPQILIIDEATNVLAIKAREMLYKLMRELCAEGKAVIFISHDVDEIMNICDCVTILRDGRLITNMSKAEYSSDKIKQNMVGREINAMQYNTDVSDSTKKDVALAFNNVSTADLKDVSLKVHYGEILGIGGLSDCGIHDIGRAAFGLSEQMQGSVKTGTGVTINTPMRAVKHRIGYVSKDRDKEAIMLNGSIRENICLPSLKKICNKLFLVNKKSENDFANKWVGILSIKTASIKHFCSSLSGGNKQKVSLSRWLANESQIFVLDCPTRGIDVGVKDDIYKQIIRLKEEGKAILLISEELPELLLLSDRLITIRNGSISGEFTRAAGIEERDVIQYVI